MSRLKVDFLDWFAVGSWKWLASDDSCGICRMPFDACCAECEIPGDDCPIVWGECSHCFHLHCINQWLKNSQQQCPMCRQDWRTKEQDLPAQAVGGGPPPPGLNSLITDNDNSGGGGGGRINEGAHVECKGAACDQVSPGL